MRKVLGLYSSPRAHWVGDGFPVRSMFSPGSHGQNVSPFILLDYAGPAEFKPADRPRGVGQHPHRGFETVTIVYQGELEHRDFDRQRRADRPRRCPVDDGRRGHPARGIPFQGVHPQGRNAGDGAALGEPSSQRQEGVPRYQTLLNQDIPSVGLSEGAGTVRVIAGDYQGQKGPARTFTPINIWDLRLAQGKTTTLTLPEGHTVALVVLRGTALVNGAQIAREAQLVLFTPDGGDITLEANDDVTVLVLSAEPINEPVVAQGPFVMNTVGEIKQAILDFEGGKFGAMQ